MTRKQRAEWILEQLEQVYGVPPCTLDAKTDPWQLLVAAILAAQCTDARVNLVTPALFEAFPNPEAFAAASPEAIEPYISSCGLYRNKAKGIYGAACVLLEEFAGVVPQSREELLRLPGVGRKIANLLLGECFGQQAIVVDTHCGRLARRMGLTREEDPARVERDLMRSVPQSRWADWGHLMVEHGRAICTARTAKCADCVLRSGCPTGAKNHA